MALMTLPMLGLADIGIAYRAKPIVRDQADYAVTVAGTRWVMTVWIGRLIDSSHTTPMIGRHKINLQVSLFGHLFW